MSAHCTCGVASDLVGGPHEGHCAMTAGTFDEDAAWDRIHAALDRAEANR